MGQQSNREALAALLERLTTEQHWLDEIGETAVSRDLNVAIETLRAKLGETSSAKDIERLRGKLLED